MSQDIKNHAAFIWSVADLLRGDYKQSEYGKVILPLDVLRRLDCVLEPTKASGPRHGAERWQGKVENVEPVLRRPSRRSSSTTPRRSTSAGCSTTRPTSPTTCAPTSPAFSPSARDVIEKFDFDAQIDRLDRANLLYLVVVASSPRSTCTPTPSRNIEMGYLYEELIRRFSELSNETAGEHFTPREVIRLMVEPAVHRGRRRARPSRASCGRCFDPACGTGGMLSVAEDYLRALNPERAAGGLRPGAERRDLRDLPLRHDAEGPGRLEHRLGNSFTEDGLRGRALRLPARQPAVRRGVEEGRGRGQGRARASSASPAASAPACRASTTARFLFLQHMISQDEAARGGRLAARDRLQRLAAVHRRRRLGRARDPALDHRERLARGHRRPARPALLQHRHLAPTSGSSPTARRPSGGARSSSSTPASCSRRCARASARSASEISDEQIAEITRLYGDVRRGRAGQDPPERGVRVPAHHRRAAAPPALGGHRRDARRRSRPRQAGRS